MVVDDEKRLVSLVESYLHQEGFRVVTAFNGREALSVAKREKPDLIILDLMMPEMDGHEFIETYRRENSTPIILLTARVEEEAQMIGLELRVKECELAVPHQSDQMHERDLAGVRAMAEHALTKKGAAELRFCPCQIGLAARELRHRGRNIFYTGDVNFTDQTILRGAQFPRQDIDVLVVDLQDIGVRSYTFTGAMEQAMEGCFENNVEVIVLDRPNPLGGLKVDGPPMDPQWLGSNLVNSFPVPYVHGLTIGELALLAKGTPGVLRISEAARTRGRLIVIPMNGWRRSMRWPETGLPWIPTSPFIPDFAAVVGYPMTGLGCQLGTFTNGIGSQYPFRGIYHPSVRLDVLERELGALHLPGLQLRRVSVPNSRTGQPASGIYLEVADWDEWRPTDLNFYLMRLACKLEPRNPFAAASRGTADGFLRVMGSTAFFRDLAAHGARVDVASYIRAWEAEDRSFQQESRRFWLYQ